MGLSKPSISVALRSVLSLLGDARRDRGDRVEDRAHRRLPRRYAPFLTAASASLASCLRVLKNSLDWPMNSPSAVRALTAPIAALSVRVGRTIEHIGRLCFRKIVGSGMIRFDLNSSPPSGGAFRLGNSSPLVGSTSGGALPALSCHVWKCIASVGPMLSSTLSTSGSLTRWASDG